MKLTKRLKTCLVLFLIVSNLSVAAASPGRYVKLDEGQVIPWQGWCFDQVAMAKIIAGEELEEEKCQLKLDKQKEKITADFNLEIEKLRAEMLYEVQTREDTIEALKKENLLIEQTMINNQRYGWVTPALIGLATGAAAVFLITL